MLSKDLNVDWLFRLKQRILLSILAVLAISIVVTMVFIAVKLKEALITDSRAKTQELAVTIDSNLHQMMILQARDSIQATLEHTVEKSESVERVFILNNQGEVTYSSDKDDIGTIIDRQADISCNICHQRDGLKDESHATVLTLNGSQTHRNISLVENEQDCQVCHDPAMKTIGKLVIDRSLADTFALTSKVQLILVASGVISLLILIPLFSKLLSRGIDKYILEIFTRNEELRLLYAMVERLSKTLDIVMLKEIVIGIFKDILSADEMVLVLAKGSHEYSASIWTNESGKVDRKKISDDDALSGMLQDWLAGKLGETNVSNNATEICMPIEKGGHRLALIVAKKGSGSFDAMRLKLTSVISSHIAVAFDNARLYYLAITDELTKAFTKRHFRKCIDDAFQDYQKYGNKFALLMMDLDKFKQVNDTHGHVVGDEVLKQLGDIIHQSVRENDLVFRYGGEEFAVILPATDVKGAKFVAERVRAATEDAVFAPGTVDLKLTISIGVATGPDAPSVRDVIVSADKALYKAKHQGRNQVVVTDNVYEVPGAAVDDM